MSADSTGQRPRPRLVEKVEAQRERHMARSLPVRYATVGVGLVIFLAGVVMLVTPGPAFVLIPIGLAVMSFEFAWAARLLERSLVEADRAAERARNTTTKQRIATAIAGVLAALAVAGGLYYWAQQGDVWLVPWF